MTLPEWLEWANVLDGIYLEELRRSIFSDREAFVNWTFHWANGKSPGWIRARIRESTEWENLHRTVTPAPAPSPSPVPAPLPGAGRVIRVTNEGNTFHPRMYSYWSNAYVHPGDQHATVFAGSQTTNRSRFFSVNLLDGAVNALPRADEHMAWYLGTTEGWSWDSRGWIYLADGPRLIRRNPFNGDEQVIVNITARFPGCRLWQTHSTDDGKVHCGTVEKITSDGPYLRLGTLVVFHGEERFYPWNATLDESQVTTEFLIIKEGHDNRIITLATGEERRITDAEGAVGHSDCEGPWLVGEDDQIGACVRWDLRTLQKKPLFTTWNMGHVSLRGGRILTSGESYIRVLDLEGDVLDVFEHGYTITDYDSQLRANWDPTGRIACYMVDRQVYLYIP